MPQFSIIVPVYNVEKYLCQCIESVLNQDFTDYELILVDDGSIDQSPRICDEYKQRDDRIIIIHKTNGGAGSARKEAARIAKGEYVLCLDGDDFLPESCLREYHTIIEQESPDVIMSGYQEFYQGDYRDPVLGKIMDVSSFPEGLYKKSEIEEKLYPYLIQNKDASYLSPHLWAKALRRELYTRNQKNVSDRIKIGEDGAVVIPVINQAASVFITHQSLYIYRINSTSLSNGKHVIDMEAPAAIYDHLANSIDLRKGDFQEQLYRKNVHDLFLAVSSQFHRNEPYSKIVKELNLILDKNPYRESLNQAEFSHSFKAVLMQQALKRGKYLPVYMYSRMKEYFRR